MSARELTRVGVLSRVKAGTLSVGSAATLLAVSYRQAKRSGAAVSGGGREGTEASERRAARRIMRGRTAERERVLALVREKYSGPVDERFGPTLAAEHLASEDGVTVHHDTLAAVDAGRGAVESGAQTSRRIVSGGSARRISASWCSSMAVSICGSRRARRAAA